MKISPLQLKRYVLTEVTVKANLDYAPKADSPGADAIAINTEVVRGANTENSRDWKIDLKVSVTQADGKQSPYQVQIAATGFFEVSPQVPENLIERIVGANAPAVLYGAMREIVAQITARGPYETMLLPSVTFIDEKTLTEPAKKAHALERRARVTAAT